MNNTNFTVMKIKKNYIKLIMNYTIEIDCHRILIFVPFICNFRTFSSIGILYECNKTILRYDDTGTIGV